MGVSIHSPSADALGSIQVLQDSTGIEKAASRVEAPLLRGNDAEAAITERSGLTIPAAEGAVERGFGEALRATKVFGRENYPRRANYAQFYLTEADI